MGRSSSSGRNNKYTPSRNESNEGSASATSAKAIIAEARKLSQQASRKPEGIPRSSLLKTCVELFRNGLSLSLSPPEHEEALFDLGEVLLQLCGSLQAGVGQLIGSPLEGKTKKPQALELQLQNSVVAAQMCRESAEAFESVCSVKGQFEHEALVNNGVALCDWAELALEIPEVKGGGIVLAKELLARAYERYSAALLAALVDVELLVNYADCCVRRAELEVDYPTPNSSCNSQTQWDVTRGLYDQGLGAYAIACANADARVGDDLAGVLHNWGSGLFSIAERSPNIEEALKFVTIGQEKFVSAMKFRTTDTSIRIGLGECMTGFVDKVSGKVDFTQQIFDLLRIACDEGYGAALKINSRSPAALLGLGEAHLSVGKVLLGQELRPQAHKHLEESVKSFAQAFDFLNIDAEKLSNFKYEEICDSLYNFACAAALCNFEAKALEIVEQLSSIDAFCLEDALGDFDLAILHSYFRSKMSSIMETC